MNFIFFHVGTNISEPKMLVASIKRVNPHDKIIQLTDLFTPEVFGVDECYRVTGDANNLMSHRLKAYASFSIHGPSVYLDTDMLLLRKFDLELPSDKEVMVCQRSFDSEGEFNHNYKNLNLLRYKNKLIGEVFPYLACFVLVKDGLFWVKAYETLMTLNKSFHHWYGDQETIKILISDIYKNNFSTISEAEVACLPDHLSELEGSIVPFFLHFKGEGRKVGMISVYNKLTKNR